MFAKADPFRRKAYENHISCFQILHGLTHPPYVYSYTHDEFLLHSLIMHGKTDDQGLFQGLSFVGARESSFTRTHVWDSVDTREKGPRLSSVDTREKGPRLSSVDTREKGPRLSLVWTPERRDLVSLVWTPERRDLVSLVWSPERRDLVSLVWTPERRDLVSLVWTPERRDLVSLVWTPERRDLVSRQRDGPRGLNEIAQVLKRRQLHSNETSSECQADAICCEKVEYVFHRVRMRACLWRQCVYTKCAIH